MPMATSTSLLPSLSGGTPHRGNVTRPTLIKRLEAGDVPCEMGGRQRRIRLDDILVYQEQPRARRAEALPCSVKHRMTG